MFVVVSYLTTISKKRIFSNDTKKFKVEIRFKFVYLKVPNPIRENVISFPSALPKEFGLEKYIDYEKQFEKVFLSPIENIVQPLGWTTEKQDTLDLFFG